MNIANQMLKPERWGNHTKPSTNKFQNKTKRPLNGRFLHTAVFTLKELFSQELLKTNEMSSFFKVTKLPTDAMIPGGAARKKPQK